MSGGAPSAVRTVGGLLPRDLLARVAQGDSDLVGTKQASYHIPKNERIGERIDQSWSRLRGLWESFREGGELGPSEHHIGPTRSQWLLPLFESLGYGRLQPSSAVEIEGKSFPISHFWGPVPIHLVGAGMSIDRRTPGAPGGAKAAPHSLVQEFLNRSDDSLWAFVSNGLVLRILRDNDALSRQAYLEFDLEAILDGELYADFRLLWHICHQSRLEGERPEDCWLERWFQTAREDGVRALDDLRAGVEKAIEALGVGFLKHPENQALRERLSEVGAADQYYRELLRLVYRLIFLFVAEDREALLDPSAPAEAKDRYSRYYHSSRVRDLAGRRRGTSHSDLWTGLRTVLEHLYEGCEPLGLPALGSFLWSPDAVPWIGDKALRNDDLLLAVRHLCYTEKDGNRFPVNWRTLGAEELGSVYESLLELHPRMNREAGQFELDTAAGSERKTTGSYYTPTSLVDALLDSALEPVLERCMKEEDPEAALLDLKVCDTAAGSGHFLVAAARRIAMRLASVRTGDDEASPEAVTHALRDVIGRCVYGVDLNPLAVELCKVSLWMEALEPGKPLSFLDHHIQVGNSLLGTTPTLMAEGIPDDAFKPIEGDDNVVCRDLKRRNRAERAGQRSLLTAFAAEPSERHWPLRGDFEHVNQTPDDTLESVRTKEARWRKLRDDPTYRAQRLVADAWCSAFVWRKTQASPTPVTQDVLRQIQNDPSAIPSNVLSEINSLADQYGFFHFHLAFMDVFVPSGDDMKESNAAGWSGGFDVLLGNPPWEHTELKEKEWFAQRRPEIASTPGARRKQLISDLADDDPHLFGEFSRAKRHASGISHFIRDSGRYPLCGRGRVNLYSIFTEGNRSILSRDGRMGIIVPSGIATDDTTKFFFQDIVRSRVLRCLYGFENEARLFAGVDHRVNFCILVIQGSASEEVPEFTSFVRHPDLLRDPKRRYRLTAEDISEINPNTGTCPVFRSARDAEICKEIHRRVGVLVREGDPEVNPWCVTFRQGLFNMTSDSHLFRTQEELQKEGYRLDGNLFQNGQKNWLPLYEAKMVHHFNHRFGDFALVPPGARAHILPTPAPELLGDPQYRPQPRYWVEEAEVLTRLGDWPAQWLQGWRDVTDPRSSIRTVVAAVIPRTAVSGKLPLIFASRERSWLLTANLCSFVLDYVCRQKMGGVSLSMFILRQLPLLAPQAYHQPAPWSLTEQVADWMTSRVLELGYTAFDLEQFAHECGYTGLPFRWDASRRQSIQAELDAAFFHLYGIERDDVDYIMGTFPIVKRRDDAEHGEYRTKRLILEIYDAMEEAMAAGRPYNTPLDPPPGDPRAAHPMASAQSS